ncbi:MAG: hypothetical protein J5529_05885 [Prevotella sp.]|nr:hypothetical protein [Prevotella sp.]
MFDKKCQEDGFAVGVDFMSIRSPFRANVDTRRWFPVWVVMTEQLGHTALQQQKTADEDHSPSAAIYKNMKNKSF